MESPLPCLVRAALGYLPACFAAYHLLSVYLFESGFCRCHANAFYSQDLMFSRRLQSAKENAPRNTETVSLFRGRSAMAHACETSTVGNPGRRLGCRKAVGRLVLTGTIVCDQLRLAGTFNLRPNTPRIWHERMPDKLADNPDKYPAWTTWVVQTYCSFRRSNQVSSSGPQTSVVSTGTSTAASLASTQKFGFCRNLFVTNSLRVY